jgi:hypothetical protein
MRELAEVCCACLPAGGLPWLAGLRAHPELRVLLRGERAWAFWPAGDLAVTRCLLAARGAELFARRDGLWFRPGAHLPAFGVPDPAGARPLAGLLVPEPVRPEMLDSSPGQPVPLTLARDPRPRPASALLCPAATLAAWADTATTHQLTGLEAAWAGGTVLLLGQHLPPLPGVERFWGQSVLAPLGWRPEPELPEAALREALGLQEEELALLREDGFEVVPRAALAPLTRAAARLAGEGVP